MFNAVSSEKGRLTAIITSTYSQRQFTEVVLGNCFPIWNAVDRIYKCIVPSSLHFLGDAYIYSWRFFFFSPYNKLKPQHRINRMDCIFFFSGLANLRFGRKYKLIFIARILCCVAAIVKFKYSVNWCEVWNQEFRKIREILIPRRATPCQWLM